MISAVQASGTSPSLPSTVHRLELIWLSGTLGVAVSDVDASFPLVNIKQWNKRTYPKNTRQNQTKTKTKIASNA